MTGPKPLKGKLQKDNINYSVTSEETFCLVENFFYFEDVKSACEWLLEQIREKRIEILKASEETGATDYLKGAMQAWFSAGELIKEAFADIFEEEGGGK